MLKGVGGYSMPGLFSKYYLHTKFLFQ